MKKFITMAAVIAMLAAFTGCSNNNNSVSDSSSTSSEATSSAVSESTPEDAGSDSADSSDAADDTNSDAADENSSDDSANDNGETSEGKAAKYAEAALTAGTWPGLEALTDADIIENVTGIKVSDAEDYYIGYPATSANCEEIIVIKPAAGNEDAIKEALDNHFAIVTDPMNIYPSQEATVAGAVTGTTADGYYYLIVNASGSDCADALNALEA